MGGYNSGGWNAKGRPTTAFVPRIDVNHLNKVGTLREGSNGTWRWSLQTSVLVVHFGVLSDRIVLSKIGAYDPYAEHIATTWKECRFGGKRPFFICPDCGGHTLHLYRLGRFACRECHELSYPSQRERESDRAHRRANKIRNRLCGEHGWRRVPPRPKGMHQHTYLKLVSAIARADAVTDQYAAKRFGLSEAMNL